MKKTVIAVIAAVSLVNPVMAMTTQEQIEIQRQKTLENMLYQVCLDRMYIHYSQAYEINTCICFVEENLKLSEEEINKMSKSNMYMLKTHEKIFGQCHQKNLKYTGMLTSNPYHQESNEQLKWEY